MQLDTEILFGTDINQHSSIVSRREADAPRGILKDAEIDQRVSRAFAQVFFWSYVSSGAL